jgi:hypothetical protein
MAGTLADICDRIAAVGLAEAIGGRATNPGHLVVHVPPNAFNLETSGDRTHVRLQVFKQHNTLNYT